VDARDKPAYDGESGDSRNRIAHPVCSQPFRVSGAAAKIFLAMRMRLIETKREHEIPSMGEVAE
jgi:hypothetical protein